MSDEQKPRYRYVFDAGRDHVKITGDGVAFKVSLVLAGTASPVTFVTDKEGAALLKKALSAVLEDAGL